MAVQWPPESVSISPVTMTGWCWRKTDCLAGSRGRAGHRLQPGVGRGGRFGVGWDGAVDGAPHAARKGLDQTLGLGSEAGVLVALPTTTHEPLVGQEVSKKPGSGFELASAGSGASTPDHDPPDSMSRNPWVLDKPSSYVPAAAHETEVAHASVVMTSPGLVAGASVPVGSGDCAPLHPGVGTAAMAHGGGGEESGDGTGADGQHAVDRDHRRPSQLGRGDSTCRPLSVVSPRAIRHVRTS